MTEEVLIYRGFKDYFPDGVLENPFQKEPRNPTETSSHVHLIADEWFFTNFAVKARSQTIICSTDIEQAKNYLSDKGVLAKIDPVGNYRAIYSVNVKDFLNYAFDINSPSRSDIFTWLCDQDYQCVSSLNMIPPYFKGEIMLDCQSFQIKNILLS